MDLYDVLLGLVIVTGLGVIAFVYEASRFITVFKQYVDLERKFYYGE